MALKRVSGIGLFKFQEEKQRKEKALNASEDLNVLSDALVEISDSVIDGEMATKEDMKIISDALVEISEMVIELTKKVEE